jgi:uncharacterized protein DUF6438
VAVRYGVRASLLVVLAGCWTGPVAEPVPEPVAQPRADRREVDLEIHLERSECFGRCPVYELTITSDGTLRYVGKKNVTEVGERTRRLARAEMLVLQRTVDHVHFFELDNFGHERADQGCTTVGNNTTCKFSSFTVCSDTSHTVLKVTRPRRKVTHQIDDAHCSDDGAAAPLEQRIEDLAQAWIGVR